nr:Ras-related protein RABE1c-like [Tanacetum cinerariifolium]
GRKPCHHNSHDPTYLQSRVMANPPDIRTWHSNIEQHASAGVNKILIGNKCDWDEKRAVTIEQGKQLADEFGLRFLETSAKANEGVEEAFFT